MFFKHPILLSCFVVLLDDFNKHKPADKICHEAWAGRAGVFKDPSP